ncbi:MAG: SipW-dependent-type signal peptide-containing protein [Clostridiales bacterium]|nr:SipW-dependent-type signal peptide-containing protein [Clostridiales bacterium]
MSSIKQTRRTLVASVLALVVCAAMLIGTTFAWFTDSVSSGKNQIVAGNLDVDLQYATVENDALTNWTSVQNATDLFGDGLWEPGYAQVVYLRVENLGTLAVKYQLSMNIVSETAGKNVAGDEFLLSDYLQYGVVEGKTTPFASRADAIAAVENPVALDTYSTTGKLEANAEPQYVALVVYMPTTVGNEANYRDEVVPTIELGVNLVAAQDTVESDSFDNTYDQNAGYPVSTVIGASDAEGLKDALQNPGVPTEITIEETLEDLNRLTVTGDVTMNMGTNMLSGSITGVVGADIEITDGGKLTINAEANSGLNYNAGKLTASGKGTQLTVNGGKYGDSGAWNSDITAENGAVVTLNDGSFSTSGSPGHAATATSGGTLYIYGGSYSTSGASSITIYADGGTVYVENYTSISANGDNFGVANGGVIYVSKTLSQPTNVADGCTVTDGGDYWVIAEA